MSRSSSSMINFVILLMLFPLYSILRLSYPVMIPMVMTIVTIGSSILLWFSANAVLVFNSIGKDATLTGRADMWPYMIDLILKQPWLGYGYSAVWIDWDSPGAYVWRAAKWVTPNAHNGFLDLCLELGLLGAVVFAIDFCKALFKGITRLQLSNSTVEFWPLLYLTYMVVANLGESSLLNRNDISWLIYVAVSLSLEIDRSGSNYQQLHLNESENLKYDETFTKS
jgi:exopolysaccharide production protein ExoQ